MGFYERIIGSELPRIPAHTLTACLAELERGFVTRAQLITACGIQVSEEADLDALIAKIVQLPESYSLGAQVVLTNVGASYDSTAGSRGLGFVAVDVTGITRAEIRIRYNKVGTGTLRWQLYNETNDQDLGFIDDAVVGDNKTAAIVVTPTQPLSGGVKLLRPRVQSTVAADDPVYYGSCLMIRRVSRLAAPDLHEVLMLASDRSGPYNTAAAVKARLGIT